MYWDTKWCHHHKFYPPKPIKFYASLGVLSQPGYLSHLTISSLSHVCSQLTYDTASVPDDDLPNCAIHRGLLGCTQRSGSMSSLSVSTFPSCLPKLWDTPLHLDHITHPSLTFFAITHLCNVIDDRLHRTWQRKNGWSRSPESIDVTLLQGCPS
jgi:hypothetical protein